jgi:hypothetical protein
MCLVGDRQQHAERVDAAAIHSPETVLIGCFAGACGFGSLDCELIRDFSRCGRLVLLPDVLGVRLQQQSGLVADVLLRQLCRRVPGVLQVPLRPSPDGVAELYCDALQRMLGHTSAKVTLDAYADLFDDDLDAVAVTLHARYSPEVTRKCGRKGGHAPRRGGS